MHMSEAFQSMLKQKKLNDKKYRAQSHSRSTEEHRLLSEADARNLQQDRCSAFLAKCFDAIERLDCGASSLSRSERNLVISILGGSGASHRKTKQGLSPLASNINARNIFFGEVYAGLKQVFEDPETKLYFATLVDRKWLLPLNAQSLDLHSMTRRVKTALRDVGWEGILFVEIQTLTGMPAGHFLAHFHGFMWRADGSEETVKQVKTLFNKRFRGVGKAVGLDLQLVDPDTPKALPTRFFYATKLSETAKTYVKPDDAGLGLVTVDTPGKMKTAHEKNFTDLDALRIVRLLAQHEVDETTVAVGKRATKLRKAASKALKQEIEKRNVASTPSRTRVRAFLSKLLREAPDTKAGDLG